MKIRLAVLGLLMLVVGAACNPVIIGDSLSAYMEAHGAYNRMPGHFTDGDGGRGVLRNGRNTGVNGVNAIPAALQKLDQGGWLVIELGTNDIGDNPITYRDAIADMMVRIPTSVCVAWVTPYSGGSPTNVNRSNAYRNYLYADIGDFGHPCTRVIDWFVVAQAHPEYLQGDRIHLTPLGEYRFAELVDTSI